MIKIDFHGSTHGHFLEYITNVYIMQTAPSKTSIFKPPTYSAHAPDKNYLDNRLIKCGHFSNPTYNLSINNDDTIIRIAVDVSSDNMFFIALTNLMYKAGDFGFEQQMLSINESIRNNPVQLRNNWYSKFNERLLFADHYREFKDHGVPVFEFPFEAFFSFTNFCISLANLATFLNQTFFPDQSLHDLWKEFIAVNQGWQSYNKCNQLLADVFANSNESIDCTVIEQGWINYNLSKMCRLYDGALFDQDQYPTNTQLMHSIVQEHLTKLRY